MLLEPPNKVKIALPGEKKEVFQLFPGTHRNSWLKAAHQKVTKPGVQTWGGGPVLLWSFLQCKVLARTRETETQRPLLLPGGSAHCHGIAVGTGPPPGSHLDPDKK